MQRMGCRCWTSLVIRQKNGILHNDVYERMSGTSRLILEHHAKDQIFAFPPLVDLLRTCWFQWENQADYGDVSCRYFYSLPFFLIGKHFLLSHSQDKDISTPSLPRISHAKCETNIIRMYENMSRSYFLHLKNGIVKSNRCQKIDLRRMRLFSTHLYKRISSCLEWLSLYSWPRRYPPWVKRNHAVFFFIFSKSAHLLPLHWAVR